MMPVARYFLFVGGALLALLFAVNALVPQDTVVAATGLSSPGIDKSTVRIRSTQKLPERVVYDTSLPTIVPPRANVIAAAAPPAPRETSAQARVRDTFAQFIPPEKGDAKSQQVVAEAKPVDPPAQARPAPKKRKIARSHPPTQLQPTRLAQPSPYQPFRVAQQQPRSGFFGFGTW
ncbi:hypothetical protein IC762_21600 [Bradyrhizobium genosp. L]|uniref:hypothetical protein n=1 Tax=Bradyrhizobium genosp. L TaxID=83637 RepID=UPI0018A301BE|nr:hypothetical protein [Bradyrhizobium genosp. L]QPF82354.1 hypothetical protein IC762_21600 [Bradyrhizobium genosp. L]